MMHEFFKTMGQEDHAHASSWVYNNLLFPTDKGPVWLTIDDRAWLFEGTFPDFKSIDEFKPWNKR
jgi:hypothetical protein